MEATVERSKTISGIEGVSLTIGRWEAPTAMRWSEVALFFVLLWALTTSVLMVLYHAKYVDMRTVANSWKTAAAGWQKLAALRQRQPTAEYPRYDRMRE